MKIHNALYDIHEYADLIRGIMQALDVQSETLRYVSELSELILKRVDFIRLHLGMEVDDRLHRYE